MTKSFFPALQRCLLVVVLSLLAAVASGQSDQAGPSAVLVPGMTSLPDPTLVMIDGRENEIFTRRPTFVPGMDIINIHLSHLGGNNFLWRIDFLEQPAFDEGVFNFYLDLDLDAATGIQAVEPEAKTGPPPPLAGADLSVTFSQNKCTQHAWTAAGAVSESREIPFYIRNRELYFRTELNLPAKQGRVSLAIAANTHSIVTPEKPTPVMRDTTRRVVIHRFELKSEKVAPNGLDSDGDGIPDAVEATFGTRPDR
ncbi:MAG TPA: thrombospondin type 3 repeat-containing protein, partial [Lentisphaeria bacterium]|nr:thrombospondin type 3 repeat-containing protein [Lentisphaeria bacterium]